MSLLFIADLPMTAAVFLVICIFAACVFEFVNGFHDTANAVATVIYTHSLKPVQAVVWSGIWNFLGVLVGVGGMALFFKALFTLNFAHFAFKPDISVSSSIVKLLPLSNMMTMSLNENIAIILAVLLAAIIWNLLTWYKGIPCSSSHTLIGSLLGVGVVFFWLHGGDGVNWAKAREIGISLFVSPLFGFSLAILLMYLLRRAVYNIPQVKNVIFSEPKEGETPPRWVRGVLILTCTLVSFFHGSNDGQKGVGLIMVILIGFMPLQYAINPQAFDPQLTAASLSRLEETLLKEAEGNALSKELKANVNIIRDLQAGILAYDPNNREQVANIRKRMQTLSGSLAKIKDIPGALRTTESRKIVSDEIKLLKGNYEYAPIWVLIIVSLSLGTGTMIGWKRIVVTIGEKIGKQHLSYAQGACAELCAASTIGLSTGLGLPVSTTHVLSSGVAGTMVASRGVSNLQPDTIKSIAIAWLLTLPVSMILAGGLYMLMRLAV